MKNWNKLLCLAITALMLICATDIYSEPKQTKVYIFGVSINFTDSTTYITDVQALEPAYIETRTGFLYDRSIYSQQLQIWVEYAKNQPNTTCTVFFSENKSQLEKKYIKVRNNYNKDQSTKLKTLNAGEFKFIPQEWTEHERL